MARRTTRAPATDARFPVPLRGIDVDAETRCAHWEDQVDVIALRFACCDTYYPCFSCHEAATDHEVVQWPADRFDEPAVLCGACRTTLTAAAYLSGGDACPHCGAAFNLGCREHRHLYFEVPADGAEPPDGAEQSPDSS